MRSRYAAYSLGLVDYIIKTTHPSNSLFQKSGTKIRADILQFCTSVTFAGLEIIDFQDGATEAFVTFRASLFQGSHDISFEERSQFLRLDGRWLYCGMVQFEGT